MNSKIINYLLLLCFILIITLACSNKLYKNSFDDNNNLSDLKSENIAAKKIGISLPDTVKNPFFVILYESIKNFSALNDISIIVKDSQNNIDSQISDIQDLIKNKIDLLVIIPVDNDKILHILEVVDKNKIPIVTIDRTVNFKNISSRIESNNIEGGKLAADYIKELFPGGAKIVEIEGTQGASTTLNRGKGFHQIIKKTTLNKIVSRKTADFDRTKAADIMQEIINHNIEFDVVFAHNDEMAIGAISMLQKNNLSEKVKVIGFDAIPEALNLIKEKMMAASIAQNPAEMGTKAMQTAIKLLNNEKVQEIIFVPVKLVNQ